MTYHIPVLLEECLDALNVEANRNYFDCTLGGGGHTEKILQHCGPNGTVTAFDRDPDAIAYASNRLREFGDRFQAIEDNYDTVGQLATHPNFPFDGLLLDAGVSSHQLDEGARGFSFSQDAPLDMRMSQSGETAKEFLENIAIRDLAIVLSRYGDVKNGMRVAHDIKDNIHQIDSTIELADLVGRYRKPGKIHPATLVFQAIRIAVNDELQSLDRALDAAIEVVKPGGRIAVISFHSGEDRIVKTKFKAFTEDERPKGIPLTEAELKVRAISITRKPIVASEQEVQDNPRSRSAKLRVIEVKEAA